MCGVFVVVQRDKPIFTDKLKKSMRMLKHRGPDFDDYLIKSENFKNGWLKSKKIHISLAHTRLKIRDLGAKSNQPLMAPEGSVISFNGEIYNFVELKNNLLSDVCFQSTGDTEVLLAGLMKYGTDFLNYVNGMWAFSFWDNKSKTLISSRDRYGKKPLYYYIGESVLCISSEIAPILHYIDEKVSFNRELTSSFIFYDNYINLGAGNSFLNEIKQVSPSHYLVFDPNTWSINEKRYYTPEDELKANGADSFEQEELQYLILDAVSLRARADRPIGLLLSGGIDSSLILNALVQLDLQDQIRIYIGDTGKSEDAWYAQEVVKALNVEATTVKLQYQNEAFERYLKQHIHFGRPMPLSGNANAMTSMYEEISKEDVPVVLDGTGADEVFGGYWDRYLKMAIHDAVTRDDEEWLASLRSENADIKLLSRLIRSGIEGGAKKSICPVADQYKSENCLIKRIIDPLDATEMNLQTALVKDAFEGRLGVWLAQNDSNAMMYGVENRSPFLDFRLTKFMSTNYREKFFGQWNKYELRRVFSKFKPLPTQWRRQKQGFRWQVQTFLTENKAEVLEMIMSSKLINEFINVRKFCDAINNDTLNFENPLTPKLLSIAALEDAYKEYL